MKPLENNELTYLAQQAFEAKKNSEAWKNQYDQTREWLINEMKNQGINKISFVDDKGNQRTLILTEQTRTDLTASHITLQNEMSPDDFNTMVELKPKLITKMREAFKVKYQAVSRGWMKESKIDMVRFNGK